MDRDKQVKICLDCAHKEYSSKLGIICGKTHSIQTFEINCIDFRKAHYNEKSASKRYEKRHCEVVTNEENIDDNVTIKDSKDIIEEETFTYITARKSEDEIKKEHYEKHSIIGRLKRSTKAGIVAFFIAIPLRVLMLLTIGPTIAEATGPRHAGLSNHILLRELPDYYTNCLIWGLVGFIIIFFYLFFVDLIEKESLPIHICDKCYDRRIQKQNGDKCECGGTFYHSSEYKEVKEEKQ